MRQRYEPVSSACTAVRHDIQAFLLPFGFADDVVQNLIMVVHELAANAVDHARTAFSITLTPVERTIRIEVEDGSVQLPRLQPPDPSTARGRGLRIVDALTTTWTWTFTAHPTGKVVRAEVATG